MKFKYWALSLLACGGMLSCTNEDVVDSTGKGETSTSYLAVNIKATSEPGTRLNGYEYGSDAENQITNVRFYFFDKAGEPVSVNGNYNYKDVVPGVTPGTTDNVEEVTTATLVLENVKGEVPASMVAVVNPSGLGNESKSLSDLKSEKADYSSLTTGGAFVMSNSVYAENGQTVCETLVGPYLQKDPTTATNNPVDVYVERVLAKVKVTFNDADLTSADENKYPMYRVSGDSNDDPNAIFAEVHGWQLAGYGTSSNLFKIIDPSWNDTGLGFTTPWNSADYHRSFWATSTGDFANTYTWNQADKKSAEYVYTQENTPTSAVNAKDNDLTKVVVAVKLVGKDGTAKPRYVYLGGEYASEEDILNVIAPNFSQYYIKTGENAYTALSSSELHFVKGSDVSGDRYKVYPQLVTEFTKAMEGEKTNVYTLSGSSYQTVDRADVNDALKAYYAQVWNGGYAYYYTTIGHLGSSGIGQYGVVRNHIYDVTVSDITGFGTPVYNPDEVIIPETPSDDASYLAAKINILSWRVVSNSVILGQ